MKKESPGFTLVELAIVIIVIGLIITAVLGGRVLIESSRIKSSMANITKIQTAVSAFQQRFDAYPGDFDNATGRIPGCNAAIFCINGNGDNSIGVPTTSFHNNDQSGTTSLPQAETTQFWKHLLLADYISGVSPSANPAEPAWASTHPQCNGCGGFHVLNFRQTMTGPGVPKSGHYIIMRAGATGNPDPSAGIGLGAVNPQWAMEIDRSMDNDNATSGEVLSHPAGGLCANVTTGQYDTTTNDKNCLIAIRLVH